MFTVLTAEEHTLKIREKIATLAEAVVFRCIFRFVFRFSLAALSLEQF